jgi:hypothetical protein
MKERMEVQRLQRLAEARVRAQACADGYVARQTMCGGCQYSGICGIGRKFDAAYPDNAMVQILNDPVIRQNVDVVELKPLGVK